VLRYNSAINYLAIQPKYRKMALEAAEGDGLLNNMKKLKKRNKEEIRAEEERIIRLVRIPKNKDNSIAPSFDLNYFKISFKF